jgi:hypothetical protein
MSEPLKAQLAGAAAGLVMMAAAQGMFLLLRWIAS